MFNSLPPSFLSLSNLLPLSISLSQTRPTASMSPSPSLARTSSSTQAPTLASTPSPSQTSPFRPLRTTPQSTSQPPSQTTPSSLGRSLNPLRRSLLGTTSSGNSPGENVGGGGGASSNLMGYLSKHGAVGLKAVGTGGSPSRNVSSREEIDRLFD